MPKPSRSKDRNGPSRDGNPDADDGKPTQTHHGGIMKDAYNTVVTKKQIEEVLRQGGSVRWLPMPWVKAILQDPQGNRIGTINFETYLKLNTGTESKGNGIFSRTSDQSYLDTYKLVDVNTTQPIWEVRK